MNKILCSSVFILGLFISSDNAFSVNTSSSNYEKEANLGLSKTQRTKINRLINSQQEPSFEYFVDYLNNIKKMNIPVSLAAARYITTWLTKNQAKTRIFYDELKGEDRQKELFEKTGVKVSIENNKMHFEYMTAVASSRVNRSKNESFTKNSDVSNIKEIADENVCVKSKDILSELKKIREDIVNLKNEFRELSLVINKNILNLSVNGVGSKDVKNVNSGNAVISRVSSDRVHDIVWSDQKIKDVLVKKYPITFGELDGFLNAKEIFKEEFSVLESSSKYLYLRKNCNDVLTGKDKPIYNLELPDDTVLEPYLKKHYSNLFEDKSLDNYLQGKNASYGNSGKRYELRSILGYMESAKNEQYRRYIDLNKNKKSIKDRVNKFNNIAD